MSAHIIFNPFVPVRVCSPSPTTARTRNGCAVAPKIDIDLRSFLEASYKRHFTRGSIMQSVRPGRKNDVGKQPSSKSAETAGAAAAPPAEPQSPKRQAVERVLTLSAQEVMTQPIQTARPVTDAILRRNLGPCTPAQLDNLVKKTSNSDRSATVRPTNPIRKHMAPTQFGTTGRVSGQTETNPESP
eukprot:7776494-Pyramimonas_sp.AAC.1